MSSQQHGRARSTHNLGTVFSFEVRRTLKRRSFWVITLAVPLLIIVVAGLIALIGQDHAESGTIDGQAQPQLNFSYVDASGLIDPSVAAKAGGKPTTDPAAARQAVIDGNADLFISYPADPSKGDIEVVGRDIGLIDSGNYATVATDVLTASAREKVPDARVASVLTSSPTVTLVTYADGRPAPGMAGAILPGMFIVLFYFAILMLGNQMLNITVEEKENRVTEMILTTIHPTTLIAGKVLALFAVGLIQAAILLSSALTLPLVLSTQRAMGSASSVPIPGITTEELVASFNLPAVALGAVLFVGAFLLFTGLLISIGAVMPTAKDAGSAFAAVIITLFLPVYASSALLSDPHGVASEVLTFFPLTAPMSAMVRNAMGTLWPWEIVLVLVIIYGSAAALLALGVRLFRTGSLSYDARLDVRKALGWRRSS